MHDWRLLPLYIGPKEDSGSEYPLEGGDQAPILRATLLQSERVEHFGSTAEADCLLLLPHGERSQKNGNQAILAPGQAIRRMSRHL